MTRRAGPARRRYVEKDPPVFARFRVKGFGRRRIGHVAAIWLGLAGLVLSVAAAKAEAPLAGPVPARVVSVIDGDTIVVLARIWLGQEVRTRVRLAGVDAPELRGKCARERELAQAARRFLAVRLATVHGEAVEIRLRDIRYGKFAGRVLARVEAPGGEDLGDGLVAAGLARPYSGRGRAPWC